MESDTSEGMEDSIFLPGADSQEDLGERLTELQSMMLEMKDGFVHAMGELSRIQIDDGQLREQIQSNRKENDGQIAELKDMVKHLKEEVSIMVTKLQTTSEQQDRLDKQLATLSHDRESLINDLLHSGALTHDSRHILKPIHANVHHDDHLNGNHLTSDQDSGVTTCRHGDMSSYGEATPPLHISPMVKPFIDGLPALPSEDLEDNYESDSSLTAAVNKSLNLSRNLENRCLGSHQSDSSDDDGSNNTKKAHGRKTKLSSSNHNSTSKGFLHYLHKNAPHEQSYRGAQRTQIIRDILETERKYCTSLWVVLDTFGEPIKQSGLLTNRDLSVMFPSSLARLYEHHCKILYKLEERMSNCRPECILGDVFTRLADTNKNDILGLYRIYVQDFPSSIALMSKWSQQSHKFRKILKKCSTDPVCEGLDFTSLLLNPIQRIPKYVLLLKKLLKYTEEDHPDYYYIELALEKLKTFLNTLNSSIEQSLHYVNSDTASSKTKRKIASNASASSSSHDDQAKDSGIHSNEDHRHPVSLLRSSDVTGNSMLSDSSDCGLDPSIMPGIPQEKYLSSNVQGPYSDKSKHSKHRKQKTNYEYLNHDDHRHRNRPKHSLTVDQLSEASFPSQADLTESRTFDVDPQIVPRKKNKAPRPPLKKRESIGPIVKYHGPGTTNEMLSNSYKDLVDLDDEQLARHLAKTHTGKSGKTGHAKVGYGYNENDSSNEDCLYEPSVASRNVVTRKAQKLGYTQKALSQGDMHRMTQDGGDFVQHKASLAIERSMTDEMLHSVHRLDDSKENIRRKTGKHSKNGYKHSSTGNSERPERVRQNVWDDSLTDINTASISRRHKIKDKKKERQRQVMENLSNSDLQTLKKKRSLRDSLKSIFFGKRHTNSKVVELQNEPTPAPPGFADVSLSDSDRPNTPNASPVGISLDFSSSTYKDENGEPCSAV